MTFWKLLSGRLNGNGCPAQRCAGCFRQPGADLILRRQNFTNDRIVSVNAVYVSNGQTFSAGSKEQINSRTCTTGHTPRSLKWRTQRDANVAAAVPKSSSGEKP